MSCQKVRSDDRLSDVRNCEIKVEFTITELYVLVDEPVAVDIRSVCCLEFDSGRTGRALLLRGRNDRYIGAIVNEPSTSFGSVVYIQEIAELRGLGDGRVYLRRPPRSFPGAWDAAFGVKEHGCSHLYAVSPYLL